MAKEEKVVVESVDNPTENNESVVNSTEDVTLAPTDDVIPAPEDNGDSDIDDPVVSVVDTPAEAPVVDNPVDTPVDVPVDVPPVQVENPAGDAVEPEIVNPVVPEPEPVVDTPVTDIPADPAPVVSDVAPEVGYETPVDGACTDNPEGCGCEGESGCGFGCQGSITLGQFFGTIQECVSIAWRFHLKTRVYRVHNVLNEFYEKALDVVDDIIEQYQGICGVVEEPFVNCIIGEGKTEGEYLTELKAFVENNKCIIGDHSEIMSVIDEFLGLIDSTNYKLTSFSEHAVKSFDEFVYEDYQVNEGCHCDDEDTQEEEEEE